MSTADPKWVGGVFLGALAARAGYYLTLRHEIFFRYPLLNAEAYDGWARAIAGGELNPPGVFFLNPGYPYLLGGLYALLGRSLDAAVWLNFILGAATAAMLVWMGRRLGHVWAGRLAGIGFAAYGPAMFYEGQALSLALMAFVNTAALACLLEWDRGAESPAYPVGGTPRNPRWLVAAGVAFGVSMLLRPNVAPAIAAALVWVAWRAGAPSDRRLRAALQMGLAVAYVILPVIVRNSVVAREFTGLATNQGVAFYLGHWRGADGVFGPAPFEQGGLQRQEEDYQREASKREGRLLTSSESSRFWFREGVREIVATPARWVWLEIRKALLFWNRDELAINLDYRFVSERVRWLRWPWVGFGLIGIAALGGLRATWTAGPEFRLLWGYVGGYLAAVMTAFMAAEYRYPAVPALCLLAAVAVRTLWLEIRSGRVRPATVGAWVAAVAFVHLPLAGMKPEIPLHNLGVLYERAGRPADAEAYFRRAVAENPGHAISWNSLGLLAYNRREYPAARDAFTRAMGGAPRLIAPRVNLGNTDLQEGRLADAQANYEAALALDPWALEAWSNLGVLQARRGNWTGARDAFRRAAALAPGHPDVRSNLAEAEARVRSRGR